jgi:hypothetical protein
MAKRKHRPAPARRSNAELASSPVRVPHRGKPRPDRPAGPGRRGDAKQASASTGRAWRKRTRSEESRPSTILELLADIVRVADEARGQPTEVKHVLALLICPLLLCFFAVIASITVLLLNANVTLPGDVKPWAYLAIASTSAWGIGAAKRKLKKRRERNRRQREELRTEPPDGNSRTGPTDGA